MHTERVQACASTAAQQSKYSFHCGRFILAVAIFGASLALADPGEDKTLFNIEAQPAETALTLYARQARVQLGFAADIVDDILTNAVKGEYESSQALELLLEGTELEAEHGKEGIIIRRKVKPTTTSGIEEPAPPIAEANSLQLTQMVAHAASQTPTSRPGNTSDEAYEKPVRKREEIVVTGSRIRGAQNASPVVTFTREAIDRAGFATVEEVIDKLPQNFGAGASLDTSTDFRNTTNMVGGRVDDRAGGTSVNLRGLGASSTLVLLNGRRMSPGGLTARFTNVSSIPVTAIERVEVLTDGASAIYGSDAIGGVVNFILRQDYEGAETRLRYGAGTGGIKPEFILAQTLGKSWDDGNVLLTYEYYDSDNLANSDRDITSTNDLSRFGGTDWRIPGGNPANINAGGQLWAIPTGQDGTSLTADDFDPNAPLNLHNARSLGDVLPGVERHSAFLHLTQAIGPTELFGDLQFSSQKSETHANFITVNINVPDSNPFFVDPTGTGLTTVTVENYSFEDDLRPSIGFGDIESYVAAVGVQFDISEAWNGEFVGSLAKETADTESLGGIDREALAHAVNQVLPEMAFNPFGDGSNTNPDVLDSILYKDRTTGSHSENELWALSLNIDGEAMDIPGGTVQVATGVEFREESLLSTQPGIENSVGVVESSRDILAVYSELFFPLVGQANSGLGMDRLELSLAGRYERYSDFGHSTNPKVGLAWSPIETLTLRGTYGTSFRAPALFDLEASNPDTNRIAYVPDVFVPIVPFPLIVRTGANENLKAEEAATWTAGFKWSPERINGLSLDITYFNVNFEDRIDLSGANTITGSNDPRFATLLDLNPTPEEVAALVNDPRWAETAFGVTTAAAELLSGAAEVGAILDLRTTNLAQSVVSGLDLQLYYDFEMTLGSVDIGLNANYLFDYKRRLIVADPLIDEVDTLGRPVDFRARGSAIWSYQGWSVAGFVNYMDEYTDNVSSPARPVDSWTTVDLTIAYDTGADRGLLSDTKFSLTIQNLFDEYAPFVDTIGGLAYDSANGSPLGRFLAAQVTVDW